MEPLRKVRIISETNRHRLAATESGFPPMDNEIPSQEFAGVYLNFLDTLNPLERKVLAECTQPILSGDIADRVGINDVTEWEFPTYSTMDPDEDAEVTGTFIWRNSKTVEEMVDDIDKRWVTAAVEGGITESYDGDRFTYDNKNQARSGYHKGHDHLVKGFERVVAEIIYGDYGKGLPAEDVHPHIVELMIDPERLRELVNRWYDENYEPRIAARAANIGGVATAGLQST